MTDSKWKVKFSLKKAGGGGKDAGIKAAICYLGRTSCEVSLRTG